MTNQLKQNKTQTLIQRSKENEAENMWVFPP